MVFQSEVLGAGLTSSIDHLLHILMVLLYVVQLVLVILTVVVGCYVPLTSEAVQELHLSCESFQLDPELTVLLLELNHSLSKRTAQVGGLITTPLYIELKVADLCMDLSDRIPQSILVTS